MRMGLDPRHADQVVRGVALLPNGLGKQVRVLVFTSGEGIRLAELYPVVQLCSTSEVYGQVDPKYVPITEDAPMRPVGQRQRAATVP